MWTWIITLNNNIALDSPWAADSKTGRKSFWALVSMLFFALNVWQKFYGRPENPMVKWYWVPFYHRFFAQWCPTGRLHARIGRINFSKFLYVRILPEYPWAYARIQAICPSLLRSRKTYSRYMKKIPPSENPPVPTTAVVGSRPRGECMLYIFLK